MASQCTLCGHSITGRKRVVTGSFWEKWSKFGSRNDFQTGKDDLLDNSCFSWVSKYYREDPKNIRSNDQKTAQLTRCIEELKSTRPLNVLSVVLHPFEDMEIDYNNVT